jgi:hypothetical protein
MKIIHSKHVLCTALLFAICALVISGCSMESTVKAAPVTINSMLFGISSAGLASSQAGTTMFLQTRTGDPVNSDVYSIPMPGHAVLTHLHFAAASNTLTAAAATVSVYVNGAPTMISCAVASAETVCSDTANSIVVNEGDLVTIGMTVATSSSTNSGSIGPSWRGSIGVAFQ